MRKEKLALIGLVATPIVSLLLAHAGNWLWARGVIPTGIAETASLVINVIAAVALGVCAIMLVTGYRERRQTA